MFAARLDSFLEAFIGNHPFSGSLRITVKDKILYQRHFGFSDFEKETVLTACSMFTFYSLSKPFCAIGLMKLKDSGKISLDDHPGKYVPEARKLDPNITVYQLLHHISGIPDFEQTTAFAQTHRPGTDDRIRGHLSEISNYPNLFAPGSDVKYANINFILSALIIEAVSGMKYADYMRQEVFLPLGMHTAVVDKPGLSIPNRVQGYEERKGKLVPVEKSTDWMLGAGDIAGTVDDVYCLNTAIKNRLLLTPESWDAILSPASLVTNYGMGCWVSEWRGKQRITHSGGHLGFRTFHAQFLEDDFDVILLSNIAWETDIRDYLCGIVFDAYYGSSANSTASTPMDTGYI